MVIPKGGVPPKNDDVIYEQWQIQNRQGDKGLSGTTADFWFSAVVGGNQLDGTQLLFTFERLMMITQGIPTLAASALLLGKTREAAVSSYHESFPWIWKHAVFRFTPLPARATWITIAMLLRALIFAAHNVESTLATALSSRTISEQQAEDSFLAFDFAVIYCSTICTPWHWTVWCIFATTAVTRRNEYHADTMQNLF